MEQIRNSNFTPVANPNRISYNIFLIKIEKFINREMIRWKYMYTGVLFGFKGWDKFCSDYRGSHVICVLEMHYSLIRTNSLIGTDSICVRTCLFGLARGLTIFI